MNGMLDIRKMSAADLPAVLAIQATCYPQATHESRESLLAKLGASPATCLIASLDGEPVGYLIALPGLRSRPPELNALTCSAPPSASCLHLHDLAVTPHARAAGTGRALVAAFLSLLQRSRLDRASLVAVQNSAPFWERHGFRAVPALPPLQATLSTYGAGVQYMECVR